MALTLNPVKRHRERCRDTRQHMSGYLDGELDKRTETYVERHIRWCPNCGRMFANLSRTVAGLQALRDKPTPTDEPNRRHASFTEHAPLRWRSAEPSSELADVAGREV